MNNVRATLAGLTILAGAYALPAAVVGAQETTPSPTVLGTVYEREPAVADATPAIPPTNPCPNCGPSGSKGNGSRVWAYTNHHCLPETRTANYSATYGVGKNRPNPVQFYSRVYAESGSIGDLPDIPLALLNPGQQTTTYPLANVPPGEHVTIDIMARDTVTNEWLTFYSGATVFSKFLNCPCDFPAVTTVPSSSTLPPASTVPGTPTTTPPGASSVPGTSPGATVAGRAASAAAGDTLPATGAGDTALFIAVVLAAIGAFGLIVSRGGDLRQTERDG